MRCPSCGFDPTDFNTVLALVSGRLQHKGRVSYRALQYEFGCDEALLEAVRDELVFTQQVARDEAGRVLVWREGAERTARPCVGTILQPAVGDAVFPHVVS